MGRFSNDTEAILNELGNKKSLDFGPREGGLNVLNVPDALADYQYGDFWNDYNRPWLENAMNRNDIIRLATPPTWDNLTTTDSVTGQRSLTGFGREYAYLRSHGYHYDAATGTMVK